MADDRLKLWQTLRHHHRFSKDIDIFIPDPQYLGYLSPRLNGEAEAVAEEEPDSLIAIKPILQSRRGAVLARIVAQEANLREAFAALEILDYQRSYDECVGLVRAALA